MKNAKSTASSSKSIAAAKGIETKRLNALKRAEDAAKLDAASNGQAVFDTLSNALTTRLQACPNENQIKENRTAQAFLTLPIAKLCASILTQSDFDQTARVITAQKGSSSYVCGKTVIKIMRVLSAIAQQSNSQLDNYLKIAISQALKFDNHLNIKEIQSSMSRKILRDDIMVDMRETITAQSSYTVGTASSQTSKVRYALAALNLADIKRHAKGDDMKLTEYGISVFSSFMK